jgi:light-regulated signal transduction histidine kinase (bacteriophytochrome)
VIGKNVKMLMPDPYRGEHDGHLSRYLTTGEAHVIGGPAREVSAMRKDGSIFPIDLSISAFTLEDGRYFSGVIRDITLRKEAEQALLGYTQALERSNKELDDFAYIASHDLKEPLRGIHNHARFLLEDNSEKLDSESVSRLNRLVFLSQRMERLVNDLLYFSRLGRQELAVQPSDMGVVIRDVESTLEHFLGERNGRIVMPRALPTIVCDKPRVTELFRNLITNAAKYNDKPEKTIEIGFLESKTTAEGLPMSNVFYVKDNGLGIMPEFHQEIFRIFKRLQAAQGPEEGTGVGLTFVKKIVERHGGRIWLESAPGKGTTFYFTLEASKNDSGFESKAA